MTGKARLKTQPDEGLRVHHFVPGRSIRRRTRALETLSPGAWGFNSVFGSFEQLDSEVSALL